MVENADKMGQLFRAELNKIQVVSCLSLFVFCACQTSFAFWFDRVKHRLFSTDTFTHTLITPPEPPR